VPTIRHTIADAVKRLKFISESPRLDVEILLAHAIGVDRAQLLAKMDDSISVVDFEHLLIRRLASEPIAYILEEWEFFSMPLAVRPPTLVPRPETEHLVEAALERVSVPSAQILDIGTGTGCVALALAQHVPDCTVVATDIQGHNLALAQENAERHGLRNRVEFILGNLFEPFLEREDCFHLICSNPPYIPEGDARTLSLDIQDYEDPIALFSGQDGLDIVRQLIEQAQEYLYPGGYLLLEIGQGQYDAVAGLFEAQGYDDIGFQADLAGIQRIAIGRKPV
jgi:release factor glutamine methyltransferase